MRRINTPTGPERKKILRAAFNANKHVTISALAEMTGDSTKTIENALYIDGRYPSMWHLYVIERAIRNTGGVLPRELTRPLNRYKSRIKRFCALHNQHRRPMLIGEKKISNFRRYIYKEKLMTTGEIAREVRIEPTSVSYFLGRYMNAGDDVTYAIHHKIKTGRFSKKHI